MCGHWSLCYINLVVSQWSERDFKKILWTRKSPTCMEGFCLGAHLQCIGQQFTRLPSLHFLLAQNFKVGQRWELKSFSDFFRVCLQTYVWGLLHHQKYIGTLQGLLWSQHTHIFLLIFFLASLFFLPQLVLLPYITATLNHCHWLFFKRKNFF